MKHIKSRKEFLLELVDNELNQDQDVKVKDLKNKLDDYMKNKAKLVALLNSNPKEWEQKAALLINGNEFLGAWWQTIKADNQMKLAVQELQNASEATPEEVNMLRSKADMAKKEMLMLKKNMDLKISHAKAEISKIK